MMMMDLNDAVLRLRDALPSFAANVTLAAASVAAGKGGGHHHHSSSNRTGALPSGAGAGDDGSSPLPAGFESLMMPFLGIHANPLLRMLMLANQAIGASLGIDPTAVVTLVGLLWAANRLARQVYAVLYAFAREHMMVSIHISGNDEIFLHLMKWLAAQPRMTNSRSLMAETVSKTAWEDEDIEAAGLLLPLRVSTDGSGEYLNFSSQDANNPPRYVPAVGTHGFWFRGRYFKLQRRQESMYNDEGGFGGQPLIKDRESLVVSTFGWSPEPVKRLLQHAREHFYKQHYARTVIKRPNTAVARKYGSRHAWAQVADRPVRPMKTVVLDNRQKRQVLADINEYLHPATPRWYANRGIPLRRGYLFHGPPGTGKTSLSFALAGVFGLDIYVISLMEPTLTEEDLSALFNSLPRRCVVLLEDIDTAGLTRPAEEGEEQEEEQKPRGGRGGRRAGRETATKQQDGATDSTSTAAADAAKSTTTTTAPPSADGKGPNDWKVADLARALKGKTADAEKKGISLSGLLNAIDGVASHEGRVLIMTTNKPETLDEALIRPGRVDLQVGFTNATQEQARELFERMYEADHKSSGAGSHLQQQLPPGEAEKGASSNGAATATGSSTVQNSRVGTDAALSKVVEETPSSSPPLSPSSTDSESPVLINGSAKPQNGNASIAKNQQSNGNTEPDKTPPEGPEQHGSTTAPPAFSCPPSQLDEEDDEEEEDDDGVISPPELARIAVEFGDKIPDKHFSPAEIQGFLLKRKKHPRRALAEVDNWVQAMVEQKLNKTKVLQVQ